MSEYLDVSDSNESNATFVKSAEVLGSSLLRDFYASFRFSQGSTNFQNELYKGMRITYEMRLGVAGYDHFQSMITNTVKLDVDKFRVPKAHINGEKLNGPNTAFIEEREHFLNVLQAPPVKNPAALFGRIGFYTIGRDISYQTAERYHSPEDVHKSYFREHILGLEPTGNETFDILFGLVAATLNVYEFTGIKREDFTTLVDLWHENHPTQVFLSE